jgi:hypothetical protein
MPQLRVYADTSVFGGVFDTGFDESSRMLFEQVRGGRFLLVTSPIVRAELQGAPQQVRDFFAHMLAIADLVDLTGDVIDLQMAYLAAGIVPEKWAADALHVALATVSRCDVVVSWNFKHIVHRVKAQAYNGVNALRGYGSIAIHSPPEVIEYAEGS